MAFQAAFNILNAHRFFVIISAVFLSKKGQTMNYRILLAATICMAFVICFVFLYHLQFIFNLFCFLISL